MGGDGNCDDENNNKGCEYDGGDCCAKTVDGYEVSKKYCSKCECVDPDNQGKPTGGKNAACPITRETATATTRTTTKGVRMMAVTAAPRLWTVVKSARSTAASVRASIQTTRVHQLQNVESLSTRETAIATTRTTMKDAGTTVAIAALKLWKEAK